MDNGSGSPDTMVRMLRIIVIAMMVGVLTFAAVAAAVAPLGTPDDQLRRIFVLVVALVGLSAAMGYAVLRAQVLAHTRRQLAAVSEQNDAERLAMRQYQTLVIIGAALAEGFGLIGVMAVMLTAYWPLAVVPLAAVILLALHMPSRDRFDVFVGRVTAPPR